LPIGYHVILPGKKRPVFNKHNSWKGTQKGKKNSYGMRPPASGYLFERIIGKEESLHNAFVCKRPITRMLRIDSCGTLVV
jgi:hypothetical protein